MGVWVEIRGEGIWGVGHTGIGERQEVEAVCRYVLFDFELSHVFDLSDFIQRHTSVRQLGVANKNASK